MQPVKCHSGSVTPRFLVGPLLDVEGLSSGRLACAKQTLCRPVCSGPELTEAPCQATVSKTRLEGKKLLDDEQSDIRGLGTTENLSVLKGCHKLMTYIQQKFCCPSNNVIPWISFYGFILLPSSPGLEKIETG